MSKIVDNMKEYIQVITIITIIITIIIETKLCIKLYRIQQKFNFNKNGKGPYSIKVSLVSNNILCEFLIQTNCAPIIYLSIYSSLTILFTPEKDIFCTYISYCN